MIGPACPVCAWAQHVGALGFHSKAFSLKPKETAMQEGLGRKGLLAEQGGELGEQKERKPLGPNCSRDLILH